MNTLTAGVSYNDWVGTAAADNADLKTLRDYLEKNNYISQDEFLVAVDMYTGYNGQNFFVSITAFIYNGNNCDAIKDELKNLDEIPLKKVEIDIDLESFLKNFKRFNIMLTHKSLEIDGKEYVDKTN